MAFQFAHGSFQWLGTDAVNADKVVSGLSFAPVAIRLYVLGSSSATDAAVQNLDGQRCVGFATSTSNRRCVASWDQDAAATTACMSIMRDDAVVAIEGTAKTGLLDVQSFDSGGFTLNVDEQASGDFAVFWEAWGGSDIAAAECGDFAEPAATGNVDYTLTGAFQPDVVMFAGVQSTAAANTAQSESSGFYIGFASGTAAANNIVATGAADHSSAATDTDGYALDGECLAQIALAGGNPTARAQMTQWNSNGFRLNWIARATTGRKSIFLAIKGGGWQAGAYTINGNSGSATATVSGISTFLPLGVSLIGALRAKSTAGTSTTQDVLMAGTGSSTSSRRSMGYRSEDSTASSATEVDLCVEYDQVLSAPSTAGALLSAYDINAMNSDGFQIIVDTAGGVASEWQGYLTYGPITQAVTNGTIAAGNALYAPTVAVEAGGDQAVTGASISSTAAVNVPSAAYEVAAASIVSTLALFAATAAYAVTGSTIPTTATLYSPTVVTDQAVTGATLAAGSAVYTPSAAYEVNSAAISSGLNLYTPSLAYEVTNGTIAATLQLYAPTVAPGAVEVVGGTVASTLTLSAPTLAYEVTGAVIGSTATLSSPSLAYEVTGSTIAAGSVLTAPVLAYEVIGSTVGSTATLYAPTVDQISTQEVVGAFISSTLSLLAPTITVGDVTVTGAHVASTAALSAPSLAYEVTGASISSTLALTPPTLEYAVTGATIAAGSALFAPTLAYEVTTSAVTSTLTLFAPEIDQTSTQTVTAAHIASTTALNSPTVVPGAVAVTGATISSTATLTAPSLAYAVSASHVASTVSLFGPAVLADLAVVTGPITSTATLFSPTVAADAITVTGAHIASTATLSAPSIEYGVTGATIPSTSTLTAPELAYEIGSAFIDSAATFYPLIVGDTGTIEPPLIVSTVILYPPGVVSRQRLASKTASLTSTTYTAAPDLSAVEVTRTASLSTPSATASRSLTSSRSASRSTTGPYRAGG